MKADPQPLVIAVPLARFADWGGGIGFIRLLLEGLTQDPAVRVVALIPKPTLTQQLRRMAAALFRSLQGLTQGKLGWKVARPSRPEDILAAISDYVPRISTRFYGDHPRGLVSALKAIGASAAIPCFEPMPGDCPVAWVGYIYDFQHRYLPENFTEAERKGRDAAFAQMIEAAPVVLCNSEAVRLDAERFHPGSSHKVVSLPFTPVPRPGWFDLDPLQAQGRYGLPRQYFIVCNQFWTHKDHPTAIKAYAEFLARSGRRDVALVCTGSQDDYRAPRYLESLKELISTLGLSGNVYLVGHISKDDQMALLRGALALLQPTLFEGGPGGGAVYDAVAVGVPALVSDLEVNLEIGAGMCQFFTQRDPASLASLMEKVADSAPPRPTRGELLERAQVAAKKLGEVLISSARLAEERHIP